MMLSCLQYPLCLHSLCHLLAVNLLLKLSSHFYVVFTATDFKMPFKLEVDGSVLLLQENAHGIVHLVCIFSQKFNQHQMNLSSIEKEIYALLITLEDFGVG